MHPRHKTHLCFTVLGSLPDGSAVQALSGERRAPAERHKEGKGIHSCMWASTAEKNPPPCTNLGSIYGKVSFHFALCDNKYGKILSFLLSLVSYLAYLAS